MARSTRDPAKRMRRAKRRAGVAYGSPWKGSRSAFASVEGFRANHFALEEDRPSGDHAVALAETIFGDYEVAE